jgi:hypothetical protein
LSPRRLHIGKASRFQVLLNEVLRSSGFEICTKYMYRYACVFPNIDIYPLSLFNSSGKL